MKMTNRVTFAVFTLLIDTLSGEKGRHDGISSALQCPQSPKEWLFPDATDCSHFVVCEFVGTPFQRAQRMSCPRGLVFNPDTRACDFVTNVDCSRYISRGAQPFAVAAAHDDVTQALDIRSKERVAVFLAAILQSETQATIVTSPNGTDASARSMLATTSRSTSDQSTLSTSSSMTSSTSDAHNSTSDQSPLPTSSSMTSSTGDAHNSTSDQSPLPTSSSMTSWARSIGSTSSSATFSTLADSTGSSSNSSSMTSPSWHVVDDSPQTTRPMTSQTLSSNTSHNLDSSNSNATSSWPTAVSSPQSTMSSSSGPTAVSSSQVDYSQSTVSSLVTSSSGNTVVNLSQIQSTVTPANSSSANFSFTDGLPRQTNSDSHLTTSSFTRSSVSITGRPTNFTANRLLVTSGNDTQKTVTMETIAMTTNYSTPDNRTVDTTSSSMSAVDQNSMTPNKTGYGYTTARQNMTS